MSKATFWVVLAILLLVGMDSVEIRNQLNAQAVQGNDITKSIDKLTKSQNKIIKSQNDILSLCNMGDGL